MLAAVLLRSSVVGHAMLSRYLILAGSGIFLGKKKQTKKENKMMMMMMMMTMMMMMMIVKIAFLFAVKRLGQFIGFVHNRNTI